MHDYLAGPESGPAVHHCPRRQGGKEPGAPGPATCRSHPRAGSPAAHGPGSRATGRLPPARRRWLGHACRSGGQRVLHSVPGSRQPQGPPPDSCPPASPPRSQLPGRRRGCRCAANETQQSGTPKIPGPSSQPSSERSLLPEGATLMPGLRTPFLLRRIASAWPLLASLMLTVFIAAAPAGRARHLQRPGAAAGGPPPADRGLGADRHRDQRGRGRERRRRRPAGGPGRAGDGLRLGALPPRQRVVVKPAGPARHRPAAGSSRWPRRPRRAHVRQHATLLSGAWPGSPVPGQPVRPRCPPSPRPSSA